MEKSLDRILAGQNGVITYDKDRNGNIVPGSDKVSVKTEDGKDVYTTISAELQTYLETRMDVFQEKVKGKYVNEVIDGNQVESEFYEKKNMKSKLYAR